MHLNTLEENQEALVVDYWDSSHVLELERRPRPDTNTSLHWRICSINTWGFVNRSSKTSQNSTPLWFPVGSKIFFCPVHTVITFTPETLFILIIIIICTLLIPNLGNWNSDQHTHSLGKENSHHLHFHHADQKISNLWSTPGPQATLWGPLTYIFVSFAVFFLHVEIKQSFSCWHVVFYTTLWANISS